MMMKQEKQNPHLVYMNEKSEEFIGRDEALHTCLTYLNDGSKDSMVVYGKPGVGKSAFSAKLIREALKTHEHVFYRFVGVDVLSNDSFELIKDIIHSIYQSYGKNTPSMLTYADSVKVFANLVLEENEKIVLIIDAIDQLQVSSGESATMWLPEILGNHFKLIVMTRDGSYLKEAMEKLKRVKTLELGDLNENEVQAILQQNFHKIHRTLTDDQKNLLQSSCNRNGSALYLKFACIQAMSWKSFDKFSLVKGTSGIIQSYIEQLCLDNHHGEKLVMNTLAYIALGNHGVSEDELIDLLSQDTQVIDEVYRRSPNSPSFSKLPFMIWARLYADLVDYLKEINYQKKTLFTFYHLQIADVVNEMMTDDLFTYIHQQNIDYYVSQAYFYDGKKHIVNARKMTSLPYHYMALHQVEEMNQLLKKDDYLLAKIKSGHLKALMEEYVWVSIRLDGNEFKKTVHHLFEFIMKYNHKYPKQRVDLEMIHAYLIFREERGMHQLFFAEFIKSSMKACVPSISNKELVQLQNTALAKRVNYYRRIGEVETALVLAKELLTHLSKPKEMSSLLYDIAYIQFLKGDFYEANQAMMQSIVKAQEAKNVVGEVISRNIAANFNFIAHLFTDEMDKYSNLYHQQLDQSLAIFTNYAQKDHHANRFIANVWEHKSILAYYRHDVDGLQESFVKYQENPFVRGRADQTTIIMMQARLCACCGEYQDSIDKIHQVIRYRSKEVSEDKVESIAQLYYMLIDAYLKLHQINDAKKLYEKVKCLNGIPANHVWLNQIERMMFDE